MTTLLQKGIYAALDILVIENLAKDAGSKAISILTEHFTLTAFEIAAAYQKSYGYALAAISAGLAAPEQKFAFLQKLTHSKLEREFSEQIETHYFQPFVERTKAKALDSETLGQLRQQFIENIRELSKQPAIFQADKVSFTESELAAFLHEKGTLAITDLVIEQFREIPIDALPLAPSQRAGEQHGAASTPAGGIEGGRNPDLAAFFRYKELLGHAILFFFREILRQDERVEKTLAALQREGLWADMRDLKRAQSELMAQLEQQKAYQNAQAMQALQAGNFAQATEISQGLQLLQQSLDDLPQRLEAAQTAWHQSHQDLLEFSARFANWAALLDEKVEQVLAATDALSEQIGIVQAGVEANLEKAAEISDGVQAISDEVQQLKQWMQQLMGRFELSAQMKAGDEFTQHSSQSLELIKKAVARLKKLPAQHPDYSQLVIMTGSMLASTGEIANAEKLFLKVLKTTKNPADKALASFNLFQVRLRHKNYAQALTDLQTAITLDAPRYALHDVEKYPIVRLLGAGGMGCVFLCDDQWGENQVVVKCFWEGRTGSREAVFGEAMMMRQIAGDYVPKPLDCDYVDTIRRNRPYFVTQYIDGALDGEAWLEKHGKLDGPTGIVVGLQIAEGLKIAHQKGIYHLDLKPANILLCPSGEKLEKGPKVKIIDFGLARIANSLKQEALSRRSATGMTQFGQTIIAGTWDYAPPEQLGDTRYGQPTAKSDVFSFGATLYRLMTDENPRHLNPRRLANAPTELFELLCDCKEDKPKRRPDIETVIQQLRCFGNEEGIPETSKKEEVISSDENRLLNLSKQGMSFLKQGLGMFSQSQSQQTISPKKPERKPGDLFRDSLKDGTEGPEMVIIPAGKFRMGDIQGTGGNEEKPVHEVSVNSFAMGRYPVTFAEYDYFCEATGREKPDDRGWGRDNRPVIKVSWKEAVAYTEWLSEQTSKTYSLPSEAEWEYAARAGTETDYWWGNEIGKNRAVCDGCGSQWDDKQTAPVGSFEANPFGLYDTVGNVWEWTGSEYEDKYNGKELEYLSNNHANNRVLRGGSWYTYPYVARAAFRYRDIPDDWYNGSGFRVVARTL